MDVDDAQSDLTGVVHVFKFSDRVLIELVTPKDNPAVEGLAALHGHVVTLTIQVTTDDGKPSSLDDFLTRSRSVTAA